MDDARSRDGGAESGFRIPWVDYIKGICIAWVVHHHVLRGIQAGDVVASPEFQTFYFWTGGFNAIGTFFFMSGLFISGAIRRPLKGFLINRLMTGGYAYVVWVILFGLVQGAMGGYTNNEATLGHFLRMFQAPPWHFWYIYAMFVVSIFYVVLRKLKFSPAGIFVLALSLYVFVDYLPPIPWRGFYYVCSHMVYFALGAWLGRDGVIATLSQARNRTVLITLVVALALTALGTSLEFRFMPPTRLVLSCGGLVVVIATAILLERWRRLGFIQFLGRWSLEIYIAHVFGTAGARIFLDHVLRIGQDHVVVHFLVGMAAGFGFPIGLAMLAERVGFPYLFSLVPKSTTRKKKLDLAPVAPYKLDVNLSQDVARAGVGDPRPGP